ncbi:DUF1385 domain-containing protein [bacterium]|nr:DUF1385 domain-containing protein [candidate division CSSED10-310 bacterium]
MSVLLGGQAVMEGVMMRRPGWVSVAVRNPAGGITVRVERAADLTERFRLLKLPIVRGIYTLVSSLRIGFRALEYSAEVTLQEEPGQRPWYMVPVMVFSVLAALGVFLVLPVWITELSSMILPILTRSTILFNIVEGIIRLGFFLGYVVGISFLPDIKRFFEYHGAEHQSIHAYEEGGALTIARARGKNPRHPRCGTSFIMAVVVVAMMIFSLLPGGVSLPVKAALRLLLLPLIAGVAYEFIRYSSRSNRQWLFSLLATPGLWLQKLTTAVPDDSMLEVAIAAINALISPEEGVRRSVADASLG